MHRHAGARAAGEEAEKEKAESQEPAEPSTEDARQIDMGEEPERPVEARTVATVLNEIAMLYTELPRNPEEAVDEAMAVGRWMGDQRADHTAWRFQTYADILRTRDPEEAEEEPLDAPAEAAVTHDETAAPEPDAVPSVVEEEEGVRGLG